MSAASKPTLPFTVWIAAVDLLCLEAWQIDAYTIGPQPWYAWHSDGWTPERAVMELSTPTTLPDLEDDLWPLNLPTVTIKSIFRRIMDIDVITQPDGLPPGEIIEIALRFLEIENPVQFPPPTREDKIRALARLNITVQPEQHPLTAWMFAMCRENGLPEQRPSIPIGESAQELCPGWIWWLA